MQVKNMSYQQLQEFSVELYQQMIVREQMYKDLIGHQWCLKPTPGFEDRNST
ncbi:MAG: NblA-related protein [Moorea sp. SIO2B7]|nr:NblA-related protein [Moorena sp. SIO2B7]